MRLLFVMYLNAEFELPTLTLVARMTNNTLDS